MDQTADLVSQENDVMPAPEPPQHITRGSHGIVKPNPKYALNISVSDIQVPRTYKEGSVNKTRVEEGHGRRN